MRIAIPTKNGMIFEHFGRCRNFTIFETNVGSKTKVENITLEKDGGSYIVSCLKEKNIDVLICHSLGINAKTQLRIAKIEFIPGVTGEAALAVKRYLSGENIGNADFVCGREKLPGNDCKC